MLDVRKFNPYRGFRLITYAVWWIRAQIQSFIIASWSLLKIGTTQAQRKLFFKLKEAKNTIRRMTGGDDSAATADVLAVRASDVEEMEQRMLGEVSLDAELFVGEGASLLELLVDERPDQESQLADLEEQQQLQQLVSSAVSKLTEKEQFVVNKRITADEPMTLQEIADNFGISRERVRQIEENALKKIKAHLQPLLAAQSAL
jgi:RNA polymerase sigma-32 factor